jgi:Na+/H+ antiporter NhaD/arsenite permease-like protein
VTAVWLANTASLLLPVSNLTNLLAQSGPVLGGDGYVALSVVPALVAVVVPVLVLAVVYRRALAHRYVSSPGAGVEDPPLRLMAAVVVAVLVPALGIGDPVLRIPVWLPATVAALVLLALFAIRRPAALRARFVPWSLLLFVCGLFLAIDAAGRLGLTAVLDVAAGRGDDPLALLRLAGVGTAAANLGDNLPAYLALEPVAGSPVRLMALLVAVNAGPLITPWASLATLLWHSRLRAMGVEVSWGRFALLGLIGAPLTVAAATLALALTH